jgi:hypothetical protein
MMTYTKKTLAKDEIKNSESILVNMINSWRRSWDKAIFIESK